MILELATDPVAFAAERKKVLRSAEGILYGSAKRALHRWSKDKNWYSALLRRAEALARSQYRKDSGKPTSAGLRQALADFRAEMEKSLKATVDPDGNVNVRARALAASISTAAVNLGAELAAKEEGGSGELNKVWLSMDDERVRPTHVAADGQSVGLDEKFDVGGSKMSRPGDMSVAVELWINCRCVLAIVPKAQAVAASAVQDFVNTQGEEMPTDTIEIEAAPEVDATVPWHGVLAPEGIPSGDRRMFEQGSLRWRDLPLPLSWQKVNAEGHDGSVVVGRIDTIERDANNLLQATGVFLATAEADEAIGVLAEGGIRGVSVDVDDAKMEMRNGDGGEWAEGDDLDEMMMVLPSGRVCGATLCAIPAFMEAFIALGMADENAVAASAFRVIDEKPWSDYTAADYSDEQWFKATLVHTNGQSTAKGDNKLPILTPSGALSRAGVHAAASRIGQTDASAEQISKAKASLRSAYKELGEDVPESLVASLVAAVPPAAAAAEAERGLAWVKDGKGGSGLEDATLTRARQIAAREDLTDAHIARMSSFFARHEVDKQGKGWAPGTEGYPSAGRVAWALWGGDAGKAFANANAPTESAALGEYVNTEDGPGWLTHPVDTDRLRDYWVRGAGAAKIGWGAPGDFNRCRVHLAKYIKPQYLSGYCANRHYDALGFWPGRPVSADTEVMRTNVRSPAFSLVAAGGQMSALPKAEWFDDPHLSGPSPIVVTTDGLVFGHLALWGTCHIGMTGVCVEPPESETNYACFLTGAVLTDQGDVAVGQITMGTGHADPELNRLATMAHYDNTGSAVADISVGEDEFGIYVAGRVRSTASQEDIEALRAVQLSGDWRRAGTSLELVAALAVNVPGFIVPRVALAASGGRQTSLVAAGMPVRAVVDGQHFTMEEIAAAVISKMEERAAATLRIEALQALRVARNKNKMMALAGRKN